MASKSTPLYSQMARMRVVAVLPAAEQTDRRPWMRSASSGRVRSGCSCRCPRAGRGWRRARTDPRLGEDLDRSRLGEVVVDRPGQRVDLRRVGDQAGLEVEPGDVVEGDHAVDVGPARGGRSISLMSPPEAPPAGCDPDRCSGPGAPSRPRRTSFGLAVRGRSSPGGRRSRPAPLGRPRRRLSAPPWRRLVDQLLRVERAARPSGRPPRTRRSRCTVLSITEDRSVRIKGSLTGQVLVDGGEVLAALDAGRREGPALDARRGIAGPRRAAPRPATRGGRRRCPRSRRTQCSRPMLASTSAYLWLHPTTRPVSACCRAEIMAWKRDVTRGRARR